MVVKELTIEELMEAGAHFGHQRRRFNPKMQRFVFGERGGVFIIDLAKTLSGVKKAKEAIEEAVRDYKTVLFVGTKKQAKDIVRKSAQEAGEFFVVERWLGGMLTNLTTIRASIKKLEKIEKTINSGGEGLTKKELSLLEKDRTKLDRNLSGIRGMRKPPGLLVVVDPSKEHIAVAEAKSLGIPVIGLVDTNCDPDPIDYVIACNDDALKSVKVILDQLTAAIIAKKKEMKINITQEKESPEPKAETSPAAEEAIEVLEKQFDHIKDKDEKDERSHG